MPPYINRELSWLAFNRRVLAEARRPDHPLMERLHFLSITASNLDEFYMVRVAYLHDRAKIAAQPDNAGLTPQEQLEQVLKTARAFQREQHDCFREISRGLAKEAICFVGMEELDNAQRDFAQALFVEEILPVLTPLAVDPSRPFPSLPNKTLHIGVRLRDREGEDRFGVVQVPAILPRFVHLPGAAGHAYLPLERLIAHYLPAIFDQYPIEAHGLFRMTRSADFDADEDTDDLLEEMKRTLRKRKRGKPIRLELGEAFDPGLRRFLVKALGVAKRYVLALPGLIDYTAMGKIASAREHAALRAKPILPVPAADFAGEADLFAAIRARDRLLHHPYESFESVAGFIEAAAGDPGVLAIKQTLYRVSGKGRVIAALERAAENGKQVTVLLELKARFDEENNIHWAHRLERAGCHVIYGLAGLKTHCKVTLVVRREPEGIRRYMHLGTGNYNDATARLYTDIGLFTCRPGLGADASALFNHLTGFSRPPAYRSLVVAPRDMKSWFLERVDREMEHARQGRTAWISVKANSLLDGAVIDKLYQASGAGVEIRLLIRGICGLLPGVPGASETIRVRSIVGQLLEHSRVYAFANAGEPLVFLGSADLMPRNLDRRVETIFPVEDQELGQRLLELLEIMWRDNTNAWECDAQGIYHRVPREGEPVSAQRELARLAAARFRRAQDASPLDNSSQKEIAQ